MLQQKVKKIDHTISGVFEYFYEINLKDGKIRKHNNNP